MLVSVPSGDMIFQIERIFDSPSNASEVNSESGFADGESLVTTLELSANGCPLTCNLYDFVQPNGE